MADDVIKLTEKSREQFGTSLQDGYVHGDDVYHKPEPTPKQPTQPVDPTKVPGTWGGPGQYGIE